MKIAIAVPAPENVPISFTNNLIGIITEAQKTEGVERVDFHYSTGVRTDKNRNTLIQNILETDATHILWLDADMIYPADILRQYVTLKPDLDIMGCLYFKRSYPFDPIAYVRNDNPEKPFRWLDPRKVNEVDDKTVIEVDGLGFGGVLVKTDVYRKMGDNKWMNYGAGFHLPFKNKESLTHDLVFCQKAQEYGFKIYLHPRVRPKHLATMQIGEEQWLQAMKLEGKLDA